MRAITTQCIVDVHETDVRVHGQAVYLNASNGGSTVFMDEPDHLIRLFDRVRREVEQAAGKPLHVLVPADLLAFLASPASGVRDEDDRARRTLARLRGCGLSDDLMAVMTAHIGGGEAAA